MYGAPSGRRVRSAKWRVTPFTGRWEVLDMIGDATCVNVVQLLCCGKCVVFVFSVLTGVLGISMLRKM